MKYLLYSLVFSCCLIFGCQNKSSNRIAAKEKTDETNALKQLEEIALALKAKAAEATDYPLAQSLIDESLGFAKQFKASEYLPAVLFRAGEVARSIKNYEQAVVLFSSVYTDYPKDPLAIKALFLEANTFEDGLKDKARATLRYEQLIEKYPNDLLTDQARLLLKNIDKSPEELIREFKNNK